MHLGTCSLNRGRSVAFSLPAPHVALHFVVPAPFFLNVVAQLAYIGIVSGLVDELKAARLPHPILLIALLAKMAPSPVAAGPTSLIKVAHGRLQANE